MYLLWTLFIAAVLDQTTLACEPFIGHLNITDVNSTVITDVHMIVLDLAQLPNSQSDDFILLANMTCEYVTKLITYNRDDINICSCFITNFTRVDINLFDSSTSSDVDITDSLSYYIESRYRVDIINETDPEVEVTAADLTTILLQNAGFVTIEGMLVDDMQFTMEEPFQCSPGPGTTHSCKNKGRCQLDPLDDLYYCTCRYGFSGIQCKTLPSVVPVIEPDTTGMLAGILFYVLSIIGLFAVIAALTDDDEDEYLQRAGYSEDIRII